MPVTIRQKQGGGYSVRTPSGIKARGTTRVKALAQRNLLNAVEHSNWRPTGKPTKRNLAMRARAATA